MKTRIVVIPILVIGLISIPGCYAEGDWFPEPREPVRKQTSLDMEERKGCSALDEFEEFREYPVTIFNGRVNHSNYR